MQASELLSLISLVLGAIGTFLGVANFASDRFDRKVRLRVIPKVAIPLKDGYWSFGNAKAFGRADNSGRATAIPAIEVTNLSVFPVAIDEIGYQNHANGPRSAFIKPQALPVGNFPYRIQPRESVTFFAHNSPIAAQTGDSWAFAYAETSCGRKVKIRLRNFPFA